MSLLGPYARSRLYSDWSGLARVAAELATGAWRPGKATEEIEAEPRRGIPEGKLTLRGLSDPDRPLILPSRSVAVPGAAPAVQFGPGEPSIR